MKIVCGSWLARAFLLLLLIAPSASVSAAAPIVKRDIRYAETNNDAQTLDVYRPDAGENHPIVIWIHGGGWRLGDKRAVQQKPQAFVEQGYVFVSVNYRLVPDVTIEAMAGDIAKAVKHVRANAIQYGGDANRLFLAGHSAGAHLAALVCTDQRYLNKKGLQLSDIKGCVPVDTAAYDAAKLIGALGRFKSALYTAAFGRDVVSQNLRSPMSHVSTGKGIPPFLILHVASRVDSAQQSNAFAKALNRANTEATVYAAVDKSHASINRELGISGDAATKQVFQFLKEQAGAETELTSAKSRPPNVIVLFIDDMGYADPSCFGNPAMKTPNIDRLAKEGRRLTNFYVNSPICSASRVAITTGRYPQRYRIHSYFASRQSNRKRKMPDWLDPAAPTLAKILKPLGYRTAHFGKWHMGGGRDVDDAPLPQAYGFDESLVSFEGLGDRILWQKTGNQEMSWKHGRGKILDLPKHKTTETYVDHAIDFIQANRDQPFYLRVFPNDVHDAHVPSEQQLAKWKGKTSNPPDEAFFAVLDEMDRQIGRLVDAVDQAGLAKETLILFTSDNGPTDWPRYYKAGHQPPGFTGPLFGRKWSLYEGGIRMPFIARWKGKISAEQTDETTVMAAIDVLPTIASIVGADFDADQCDGIDLSDSILGNPVVRETPLFWEYGVHGSINPGKAEHISPQLAMRQGKWKMLCNPDGSDLKLFDLETDIGEQNNVAAERPGIVDRMKSPLDRWWEQMNAHYVAAERN
ncbi:sulfatase-like hydrolase/transferase [Stieleria marina]